MKLNSMTSSLTESSCLAVRIDSEACWEANDAALETGPVSADLRLLRGSHVDIERTLADVLTAVRDGHHVLAGLLWLVNALCREFVDLADPEPLFHSARPDDLDDQFALSSTLRVHTEVSVLADANALRLDSTPRRIALLRVYRCKCSTQLYLIFYLN